MSCSNSGLAPLALEPLGGYCLWADSSPPQQGLDLALALCKSPKSSAQFKRQALELVWFSLPWGVCPIHFAKGLEALREQEIHSSQAVPSLLYESLFVAIKLLYCTVWDPSCDSSLLPDSSCVTRKLWSIVKAEMKSSCWWQRWYNLNGWQRNSWIIIYGILNQ